MIERFVKATEDERLLNEFHPMPEELRGTVSPSPTNEELVAKYGDSDWHSWSVSNWGTKWDIGNAYVDCIDATSATASFDTAWSPPIEFYEKLVELGFDVDATYAEEGMGFAGHYVNGDDNSIDLDFDADSKEWIEKIEDEDLRSIVEDQYDQWLEYQEEDAA
jgi:hypothetical protein